MTGSLDNNLGAFAECSAENWFVAQLKPNGLTLAQRNLARQGITSFAPQRLETIKGTTARRPLFPGYVFVNFNPDTNGWRSINGTRGVTRLLIHDPRRPNALPPKFMSGLIARCDDNGLLSPPDDIGVGDRIRVLAGPFADLVTTVDSLGKDARLRVLIDLLGQKVRTSIPPANVEKLS